MTTHSKKRVSLESLAIFLISLGFTTLQRTLIADGQLVLTDPVLEGGVYVTVGVVALGVSKHYESVTVRYDTRGFVQRVVDLVATIVARRSSVVEHQSKHDTPLQNQGSVSGQGDSDDVSPTHSTGENASTDENA